MTNEVVSDLIQHGQQTTFGIEIEFEYRDETTSPRLPPGWYCAHDGSLRQGGIEYISYPLNVDQALRAMSELYDSLGTPNREDTIATSRTGTHIHVYVGNLLKEDLFKLLCLYALMEPLFFIAAEKNREENTFCIPWYRTPTYTPRAVARDLFVEGEEHLGCKYSALNHRSLFNFGTIEFRHAPTFMYTDELYRWFNFIRYFMKRFWTYKQEQFPLIEAESIKKAIESPKGYRELLRGMLSNNAAAILCNNFGLDKRAPKKDLMVQLGDYCSQYEPQAVAIGLLRARDAILARAQEMEALRREHRHEPRGPHEALAAVSEEEVPPEAFEERDDSWVSAPRDFFTPIEEASTVTYIQNEITDLIVARWLPDEDLYMLSFQNLWTLSSQAAQIRNNWRVLDRETGEEVLIEEDVVDSSGEF